MSKTAMVIGATGLVGTTLVNKLLMNRDYEKVVVLVRRKLDISHKKLEEYIIDFDKLDEEYPDVTVDDIYCCMGTTIKKAKTQERMYKIDVEYPLTVAKIAKEKGLQHFILVSSMGADAHSRFFYMRMKGELEEKLQALDLLKLSIFQPSFLVGKRKENRTSEKVAIGLYNGVSSIVPTAVRNKLGIEVWNLANAMMKSGVDNNQSVKTYDVNEISILANK